MNNKKLNVLITSGGTDCPIDDVRVITNIGTGTFGSQLAEEFLKQECNVIYLHSKGAEKPIYRHCKINDLNNFYVEVDKIKEIYNEYKELINNIKFIEVKDFDDYEEKLLNMNSGDIHIWVMCMAVSDYKPVKVAGKISSNEDYFNLNMERCPKIIKNLRKKDENAFIVGFKLSSNNTEEQIADNVLNWMEDRKVDMCVANDMSRRNHDNREVYLFKKNSSEYQFYRGSNVSKDLVEQILKEYKTKL